MNLLRSGFGQGGSFKKALSFFSQNHGSTHLCCNDDEFYMKLALEQATMTCFLAKPNPAVGCLIVSKYNKVIGQGHTQKWGGAHAEAMAFADLGAEDCEGASVYLTMEPCTHFGKQPPCINLFKDKKIKRVIIASKDPNPKVHGTGIKLLNDLGIEVVIGVLEKESIAINLPFFHEQLNQKIFVALKWAQSIDGACADHFGTSKWITGVLSRTYTHWLRQKYDCIMVGVRTALVDAPELNIRGLNSEIQNPLKIIFDPNGRIFDCTADQASQLTKKTFQKNVPTVVLIKKNMLKGLPSRSSEWCRTLFLTSNLIFLGLEDDGFGYFRSAQECLSDNIVKQLLGRPLQSVMIEGGPYLLQSMINGDLFHAAHVFVAPLIMGPSKHKIGLHKVNGGQVFSNLSEVCRLNLLATETLESDVLLEYTRTKFF